MFTFCLLEFLDCLRTSKTCLVYAIPIKETSKGLNFYNCNVQHMYFISMDYTLVIPNHYPPKYIPWHLEERTVKLKIQK